MRKKERIFSFYQFCSKCSLYSVFFSGKMKSESEESIDFSGTQSDLKKKFLWLKLLWYPKYQINPDHWVSFYRFASVSGTESQSGPMPRSLFATSIGCPMPLGQDVQTFRYSQHDLFLDFSKCLVLSHGLLYNVFYFIFLFVFLESF